MQPTVAILVGSVGSMNPRLAAIAAIEFVVALGSVESCSDDQSAAAGPTGGVASSSASTRSSASTTSGTPLATILSQCSRAKLAMACRPVGSPVWTLFAMAPRADVTFDCGKQVNCAHSANGVGWYYGDSYSWGFAPGGDAVNRSTCDFDPNGTQIDTTLRLCWHTASSAIVDGYRCGYTGPGQLSSDPTWQRGVPRGLSRVGLCVRRSRR